uniref:Uncharacterized protein n=1 Tax=Rhizophora mucronata TaxID=61149 RepID=A0A2P2PE80_RHIMU
MRRTTLEPKITKSSSK